MPDLLYEKHDHYAVFTMNRPERLNALGGSMQQDLTEALVDFTADPEMRVGIVTGTGRAFSAGADLKEMSQRNSSRAPGSARGGTLTPTSVPVLAQPEADHRRDQRHLPRGWYGASARLRHPHLLD